MRVQRRVEVSIAVADEVVAFVFAGAGVERSDAGVAGELGVAGNALDRASIKDGHSCLPGGSGLSPRRWRSGSRRPANKP